MANKIIGNSVNKDIDGNICVVFLPESVAKEFAKDADKLGISLAELIIKALNQHRESEK